tara:strand:- start:2815 stop:2991 length:177 start_codon:yes stop_codon:yes gene_type:complete
MTNGGQQYQFGMMLDQEYGEGMAEKILIRSNQMSKLSLPELRIMIDAYKAKAKQFGLS